MKIQTFGTIFLAVGLVASSISVPAADLAGRYATITLDGSLSDWLPSDTLYQSSEITAGAPLNTTFTNVLVANDADYVYVALQIPAPNGAVTNSRTYNLYLDADMDSTTGFNSGWMTGGYDHLVEYGQFGTTYSVYSFGGGANQVDWNWNWLGLISYSYSDTVVEWAIPRSMLGMTTNKLRMEFNVTGGDVTTETWAYQFESGVSTYTLADTPAALTTNLPLVTLDSSSWRFDESGTDLGTTWLGMAYDDSAWSSGDGLFGYTPNPGSYPAIQTPLTSSGQNTYYFRTHFTWSNLVNNVALVVTNYLSDGAVYYVNGVEVQRIRMPSGAVDFNTSASSTNSPAGHADVFGVPGGRLLLGDNLLEVETHQGAGSSSDMVFGLSLTAAAQYPILIVNSNLPADQTVQAGQLVTLTSDVLGSGPPDYQWWKDGLAVSGATNAWLTIPFALTNDAGSYTLVISNAFGTNLTRTALLTVTNAPVVITNPNLPADTYVVEGGPATLTAAAAGSPPMQYQWFKNNNPISDATNASYAIAASTTADTGNYRVMISNLTSSTNSRTALLAVFPDNIPPTITAISASASQIVVKFSEAVNSATANDASKYAVSGGINVVSAVQNPGDATEVTLTTGTAPDLGTVYTLSVNGVEDVFGNAAQTSGQFTSTILVDGSFNDWAGVAPLYSSGAPSGNAGAADFKDIYMYDDANYYYFRVTLWVDIDPGSGQFPSYVNMFFDTDNDVGTGYGPGVLGSDLLVQSGYGYSEKNGTFADTNGMGGFFAINNLNWLCLPAAPETNFEFEVSKTATFGEDGTPVFATNVIHFIFQGMDINYVPVNQVPASGVITYTDASPVSLAALPLGRLAIFALPGRQTAIVWNSPGTLQESSSLTGGAWTNLPTATSPFVLPVVGGEQFFRLTQ